MGIVAQLARRRRWSGVLWGAVLALVVGILGMHVLNSDHSAHSGGAASSAPTASASHEHLLSAVHEGAAQPHATDDRAAGAALSDTPGMTPSCGEDCTGALGALCVAVLVVALALVRRGRSGRRFMGSDHLRIWIEPLIRALVPRRPPLSLLCVSRT